MPSVPPSRIRLTWKTRLLLWVVLDIVILYASYVIGGVTGVVPLHYRQQFNWSTGEERTLQQIWPVWRELRRVPYTDFYRRYCGAEPTADWRDWEIGPTVEIAEGLEDVLDHARFFNDGIRIPLTPAAKVELINRTLTLLNRTGDGTATLQYVHEVSKQMRCLHALSPAELLDINAFLATYDPNKTTFDEAIE